MDFIIQQFKKVNLKQIQSILYKRKYNSTIKIKWFEVESIFVKQMTDKFILEGVSKTGCLYCGIPRRNAGQWSLRSTCF